MALISSATVETERSSARSLMIVTFFFTLAEVGVMLLFSSIYFGTFSLDAALNFIWSSTVTGSTVWP